MTPAAPPHGQGSMRAGGRQGDPAPGRTAPVWLLLAGCVLAAWSCDGAGTPQSAPDDIPSLSFSDTTLIGGMDATGAAALGAIGDAIFTGADQVVVADAQSQELLQFSTSGEYLQRIGGRGGGPGEHQAIRALWPRPDGGFCTWDVQTARVTRFGPEGAVLGTATADLSGLERVLPSFRGFLDDCSFVLRDEPSMSELRDLPEGMIRDTMLFVLFAADGVPVRTLARVAGAEHWLRNRDGAWGRVSPIFGEELFAFPLGEEFWVGLSSSASWSRYTLDGDTLPPVGLPAWEVRATEADVQAERDRRVAEVRAPRGLPASLDDAAERMAEQRRAAIREVPAREAIPAYDRVVVGTSARLWIRRRPRPSDGEAEWILLDPTAQPIGRIVLPRADEILAGSEARVLISSRDSMDAPVLRILRTR